MTHILIKTTVISGLLLCGLAAVAQDRDQRDQGQYQRDEAGWRGHLFDRVREDLDRIQTATPAISTDEYRLVTTKRDLTELQRKLDTNQFDQPQLDRVIGGVEKVLTNNSLSPRDREMLSEDLRRMRDYREHHETYGVRGDEGFNK